MNINKELAGLIEKNMRRQEANRRFAEARGWDTEQQTNMKTYEVTITAYRVMYLNAKTEEEARYLADDETRMGDLELDSIVAKKLTGQELESAKRFNRIMNA
jgi:hypothetical protein